MRERILLIEDDQHIRELLTDQIDMLGYDLETATDGATGLSRALGEDFALILLDVNLPKLGGLEICKQVKQTRPHVPIIMLTARGAELDRVLGLELGADDYVVKPFSVAELNARIKARLRSRSASSGSLPTVGSRDTAVLTFGTLSIDPAKRRVTKSGQEVELTTLEFDLLLFLAERPGRPFSRQELLEQLWGVSSEVYDNNPTAIVTKVRKKIEDVPGEPRFIKTVWGFGYKFADSSDFA